MLKQSIFTIQIGGGRSWNSSFGTVLGSLSCMMQSRRFNPHLSLQERGLFSLGVNMRTQRQPSAGSLQPPQWSSSKASASRVTDLGSNQTFPVGLFPCQVVPHLTRTYAQTIHIHIQTELTTTRLTSVNPHPPTSPPYPLPMALFLQPTLSSIATGKQSLGTLVSTSSRSTNVQTCTPTLPSSLHNEPSKKFGLLHATIQQNEYTNSSCLITL